MKRLAIFAGYDKDSIIDDYVVYYLKELKKVADIIYVSDTKYSEQELQKIKDLTIHQLCEKHGAYDFGSYKRGYQWAEEERILPEYDWLILANDSMYGPFYPFANYFKEMENAAPDFWGFARTPLGEYPHLQSYFISLSKKVFLSSKFINFIKSVRKEEGVIDVVVKYEYGLTRILNNAGFKDKAFFKEAHVFHPYWHWDRLINKKHPFIKKRLFTEKARFSIRQFKSVIKENGIIYNFEMIKRNVYRILSKRERIILSTKRLIYIVFGTLRINGFKGKK